MQDKPLLKEYQRKERMLREEARILSEEIEKQTKLRNEKLAEANDFARRAKIMLQDTPHITDHAVFRFLQRADNVNTDEVRKRIITPMALKLLDQMGWADGNYPTGANYKLVLKDGVVITILPI